MKKEKSDQNALAELTREWLCKENKWLWEENKKLKNDLMQDMKEITKLEKENKKLKEELGKYKKMFEDKLKESYIKNTAEFLDKKFPKINWFMEEDTLQELRDLWKL